MPLFKSGRKLYIARFRRVGDRKIYTWEQWHRDARSARETFTKALEREFGSGYKLLSVKAATAAEEKKILGGHSLQNPVDLLSAAVIGATAGATGAFVRKRMERTAQGQNPAFPGKPGERFAMKLHTKPAAGRKQAGNPTTGYSIAMVPRKGPRLVLPRVYATQSEAQQTARKIRRPFGTRTAVVPTSNPVPLSAADTFYYHVTKTGRRYYYFSHRAQRWMPTKKVYAENLVAQGKAVAKRFSKSNPYDAAAAASEGFHGRPVEETIEIVTPEHHHEYLAALGELLKLEVLAPDSDKEIIPLNGFKGAWLAENEERNQLFVSGGNQSLPDDQLRRFDVDVETLHETEVLGPLAAVTYHTIKYHLGDQGGNAKYRHVFGEDGGKLPILVYKVRDGLVEIAGGSYSIPDEGITN